jgi:hypothetical protein
VPVLRALVALVGVVAVLAVVLSAMRTVVLPRGEPVRLTAAVFRGTRAVFGLLLRTQTTYEGRDRLMAHYAPVSLLLLPFAWMTSAWLGFAAVFWAIEQEGAADALVSAGSALLTLGFERPDGMPAVLLSFAAAALALAVLALLLVTYLPSLYAAFAEREEQVALSEVAAGTPPSGVNLVVRYNRIRGLSETDQLWADWERWFARLAESHTALPALVHFRSPDPRQSWITSAGAILDAAALLVAAVDLARVEVAEAHVRMDDGQHVRMPRAETCIRAGYLALRRIAEHSGIAVDADPAPDDPIAVSRAEFDVALAEMAAAGVPLVADHDAAWRAWAGWRVNYDAALVGLAQLTVAPTARWSSDRTGRRAEEAPAATGSAGSRPAGGPAATPPRR